MDWQALFDQGRTDVEKAWDNLVATGVPAITAAAEQSAADWLTKQQAATQAELKQSVNQMLKDPAEPGSFAANLKDAIAAPILGEKGPMILMGVAVAMVAGYFLLRK